MQFKNEEAATVTTFRESVQNDSAVLQPAQPFVPLDGETPEIAPHVEGSEAATNVSQSLTIAETQATTPAPAGATTDGATFVAPAINSDTISVLSDDDLIAACKSQFKLTDSSYSHFRKEKELLAAIYDEMVSRFRDENLKGDKRDGKPTLKQAFALAGWNYDAARRFRQRHEQEKKSRILTAYENPPKPLRLTEGNTVKFKDDKKDAAEYVVMNVHGLAAKVDITPKDSTDGETVTVSTELLKKVNSSVKKVKVGDRLLCEDTGTEYQYEGNGKFSRTKTRTVLEQKRERELANIEVKQRREKAKAEEKERQQELRKAEAVRRELDKLAEKERRKAEAEAKKQTARNKKAAAKNAMAAMKEAATGTKKEQKQEESKAPAAAPEAPSRPEPKPATAPRVKEPRYGKNQLTVKNGCVYVIGSPHLGAIATFDGEDRNDQAWNEVERLTTPPTSAMETSAQV